MGGRPKARPTEAVIPREQALAQLTSLTKRHGAPLTARQLRRENKKLATSLTVHFESTPAARKAAGLSDPPVRRRWTRNLVIEELRRIHRRGESTRLSDLREHRQDLVSALHLVGGLRRARRLARVPTPPRRVGEPEPWDEERVISEILDLHAEGASIAASKVGQKLCDAGRRLFGSWGAAVEAAGFKYDDVRLYHVPYTDEELLDSLRRLAARRPQMTLFELHHEKTNQQLRKRFGSLEKAARKAGLEDWPRRSNAPRSKAEVLRALKAHAKTGDQALARGLKDACIAYFGTVRAAKRAAGLKTVEQWTREAVLAALKQLSGKPVPRRLIRPCRVHFGSVRKARTVAGVKSVPKKWTREGTLRAVRAHARRKGAVASDVYNAAKYYYGSLGKAQIAAGVTRS